MYSFPDMCSADDQSSFPIMQSRRPILHQKHLELPPHSRSFRISRLSSTTSTLAQLKLGIRADSTGPWPWTRWSTVGPWNTYHMWKKHTQKGARYRDVLQTKLPNFRLVVQSGCGLWRTKAFLLQPHYWGKTSTSFRDGTQCYIRQAEW